MTQESIVCERCGSNNVSCNYRFDTDTIGDVEEWADVFTHKCASCGHEVIKDVCILSQSGDYLSGTEEDDKKVQGRKDVLSKEPECPMCGQHYSRSRSTS